VAAHLSLFAFSGTIGCGNVSSGLLRCLSLKAVTPLDSVDSFEALRAQMIRNLSRCTESLMCVRHRMKRNC